MKVLVLSFYYPPDLSAGSYRAAALVDALVRTGRERVEIDVLTSCPHRYASYRDVPASAGTATEAERPVTIHRLPVGHHRSGLMDQSLAFSGFAARALRAVRGKRFDVVVATSSRLLTGFLGARIAAATGARLYLDVRDLFLDNIREMFRAKSRWLLPVLSLVERQTLRRAARVNLVSEGFLSYFERRFPPREYSVFCNGIDAEFLDYDFRKPPPNGSTTIVYAGNIGLGQGLEKLLPAAAGRLGPGYQFRIIGDGGQRAVLERELRAAGTENVTVVPPMNREALREEYRQADYLLLHLNDFSALEHVLPSKLFEYAATGKPILAGVRGYPQRFIHAEVDHTAVFAPGDVDGLADGVSRLAPVHRERNEFRARYARERIMDRMAAEILDL